MKRWPALLACAALATLPAVLPAQQPAPATPETLHRSYVFLGSDLRINVEADAPGTIRLVRGEAGVIDVTALARGGLPATGLTTGARAELNLVVTGDGESRVVVVVPADTRVTVRMPGRPEVTLGTLARTARWSWDTASRRPTGR